MKTLLLCVLMGLGITLPALARGEPAISMVLDFASVITQPEATAVAKFGQPSFTGHAWNKAGYDWQLHLEDGKIISATVNEMPAGKWPGDFTTAAEMFGFTHARGWHVGESYLKGAYECVALKHAERGFYTLKTLRKPGNRSFTVLQFRAPGK